ncbi:MAG: pentapeptide repeat-containing protein [Lyngbya sp. HA4199-MV5]|jgi:uncharacterized protein YjbI with pentapeptide repeats|nr:pentapeptide repeat-containing protein [Lyngbya sp. HA4199-MV5]
MVKLKGAVPLGLVILSLLVGSAYWLNQQNQLASFVKQVESVKVNQKLPVDPKDYLAIKRDLITLQNTLNSSVFQLISGLFFFVTAYTAWLNFVASEKKQVSERFGKAIDQLGNGGLGVRVGGIFALEQIAQSSPEEHWVVMEVLTSYVRDQSLKGKSVFKPNSEEENHLEESNIQAVLRNIRAELAISVTTDIQAALTVICRRNSSQDPKGKVIDLSFCDLRGADLKNAKLSNADLRGTKLSGANLEGANLSCAKLQGTDLTLAVLNNANLKKVKLNHALLNSAHLEKAGLQDADLTNAQLKAANLQQAKLNRSTLHFAVLTYAKLQGTDLNQSKLSFVNLRDSAIDSKTKLDKKWRRIHGININGAQNQMLDGFDFSESVLTNANFEGASLKNVSFNGADLGGANFKNSHLENASFTKTDIMLNLDMADFGGAHLQGAVFKEANIKCVNFKGVSRITDLSTIIFEDVNLANSIFQEASLVKAKFSRSMLKDVDFRLADLTEAKFDNCYSYSQETNFEQANLNNAEFTGSLGCANFRNSKYQGANFSNADISSAQF